MTHRKTVLPVYQFSPTPSASPKPGYDMSASFETEATSIEYMDRVALRIETSGTPTGQITVQGSLDYDRLTPGFTPSWFDIPIGLAALTGTPDNYTVDITVYSFKWIRLKYVRTAGTGTMTAKIFARES